MIIRPFDQWRANKARALAAIDPEETDAQEGIEVTCPECNGEREIECGCDCPRCEATKGCRRCDGIGTIRSVDMKRGELGNEFLFTRDQYLEELTAELVALAHYTGEPPLAPLVEAGMAPYSPVMITASGAFQKSGSLVLHDPENFMKTFRPQELLQ